MVKSFKSVCLFDRLDKTILARTAHSCLSCVRAYTAILFILATGLFFATSTKAVGEVVGNQASFSESDLSTGAGTYQYLGWFIDADAVMAKDRDAGVMGLNSSAYAEGNDIFFGFEGFWRQDIRITGRLNDGTPMTVTSDALTLRNNLRETSSKVSSLSFDNGAPLLYGDSSDSTVNYAYNDNQLSWASCAGFNYQSRPDPIITFVYEGATRVKIRADYTGTTNMCISPSYSSSLEGSARASGRLLYEPRRVCRRLQLLSRMEHHEQDDEQVFP